MGIFRERPTGNFAAYATAWPPASPPATRDLSGRPSSGTPRQAGITPTFLNVASVLAPFSSLSHRTFASSFQLPLSPALIETGIPGTLRKSAQGTFFLSRIKETESGKPDSSWAVGPGLWFRSSRMDAVGAGRRAWPQMGSVPTCFGRVPEPSLTQFGGYLVNAAFLLVTTAWLAGADPVAAPAAPAAPATAAPAVVSSSSCNSCGSCGDACCDSGHTLCGRLKGLFASHRHDSCGSCETCAAPAPKCCAPAPKPCCPAPAPACNSCGTSHDSCGCGSFGGRLRGLFHRTSSCCETTACSDCGAAPATAPAPAGKAEPIPAPKEAPAQKMPNSAPPAKSVQIITPESAPIPVSTPALEVAPAIVPNVPANADRKEPF